MRDATSGFRAISRAAALRLHVFTRFTYTLETILQAGEAGLKVVSVPIRVNPGVARPSRLFSSNLDYVLRSLASMARIVILYNPLRIFLILGFASGGSRCRPPRSFSVVLRDRQLTRRPHPVADPRGHSGRHRLLIWLVGIIADLIAVNRRLLEEVVERQRANGLELRH